jgi:hypothetical protein
LADTSPAATVATKAAAESAGRPQVCDEIDTQLRAAWKAQQIEPAPEVDDARFLRRVTLDLTGRLPDAKEVVRFLEDSDPQKRTKAIDRALASPAYADHWTDYWDAILMGRLTREAYISRDAFRGWLHDQFAENAPWNRMVHELIAAEGWNSKRRPGNAKDDPADMESRYSPATNWFLKYQKAIPELSGAASKTFLGVQIQCAQCHDHKTEKWTQKEFRQFTAFFVKTWPKYYDKTLVIGTHRLDTQDHWFVAPVNGQYEQYFTSYKDYVNDTPKLLQGSEVKTVSGRRAALADWMTSADNPWFAQAMVNRLWAKLLGVGFVEPIDDFRPSNPAVLPETLATLTADFKTHDFDLKHLLRTICNSTAYARACRPSPANSTSHAYWASYPVKPLDVEETFDVVLQATGSEAYLDRSTKNNVQLVRTSFSRQFVTQMGTDDMAEVAESEETIPRALLFLNGTLVNGTARVNKVLGLGEILRTHTDDAACLEQIYLRTLSRRPSEKELGQWRAFLAQRQAVVHTAGPHTEVKTGISALSADSMIAESPSSADFKELVGRAHSAADFAALRKRVKNNADGALYVKAFEAWAAEAPFQQLATQAGGDTEREQAFENIYWAVLNCSEFLSNH